MRSQRPVSPSPSPEPVSRLDTDPSVAHDPREPRSTSPPAPWKRWFSDTGGSTGRKGGRWSTSRTTLTWFAVWTVTDEHTGTLDRSAVRRASRRRVVLRRSFGGAREAGSLAEPVPAASEDAARARDHRERRLVEPHGGRDGRCRARRQRGLWPSTASGQKRYALAGGLLPPVDRPVGRIGPRTRSMLRVHRVADQRHAERTRPAQHLLLRPGARQEASTRNTNRWPSGEAS
jgi:hypothetical protein